MLEVLNGQTTANSDTNLTITQLQKLFMWDIKTNFNMMTQSNMETQLQTEGIGMSRATTPGDPSEISTNDKREKKARGRTPTPNTPSKPEALPLLKLTALLDGMAKSTQCLGDHQNCYLLVSCCVTMLNFIRHNIVSMGGTDYSVLKLLSKSMSEVADRLVVMLEEQQTCAKVAAEHIAESEHVFVVSKQNNNDISVVYRNQVNDAAKKVSSFLSESETPPTMRTETPLPWYSSKPDLNIALMIQFFMWTLRGLYYHSTALTH